MNQHIKILIDQARFTDQVPYPHQDEVFQKFGELIVQDILRVVAAQALLNESAMDVFKNLKNLYED